MQTTKVRKNFVFSKTSAKQLKELATKNNKSMTKMLENIISQSYQKIEREKKIKAFEGLIGIANGFVGSDTSIQSIKANMKI